MTVPPVPATSLFDQVGSERLRQVLWAFYARVTADETLGPVFTRRIGPFPQAGWSLHLARLEGFWRAVMGGPGAYRGRPGPAHSGLGIEPAHFDRWLALWDATLRDLLPPPEASALLALAQRMRPNLERFSALAERLS
ncbi:group III truncated hemoglobin [Deinococcus multiflagellatus]|uniref:Group III truncated hemoglobin n=1 Tax=Deinococcus multiflagellatus TaxID=1656887 RepID=A0ABW1ZS33_9DEIO|nr:group III truncated hemoglobin [Deinococcus multiflagellatus]MBZ9713591.1 group III truncated hemoglobin [Deinococcus multiflagellatus]